MTPKQARRFVQAHGKLAKQDRQMRERLGILSGIPGIGITTALMMLVDMPQIGGLGGKQVASLAGLTPMSQSSGKSQGKARIQRLPPKSTARHLHVCFGRDPP